MIFSIKLGIRQLFLFASSLVRKEFENGKRCKGCGVRIPDTHGTSNIGHCENDRCRLRLRARYLRDRRRGNEKDVYGSAKAIPEHVKIQLGLEQVDQREVELADGKIHLCDVVGPIEIRFVNRKAVSNAFVMGNEVLLGAIPMEELDVIINTREQKLVVNPENPTMPKMKIK